MEEVIRLFKLIQETSSLNEKKKIIRNNSENELFKQCLNFLLDGNVVTGISTKKLNKSVKVSTKYLSPTSSFEKVINYLLLNNTGRDEDIAEVQAFLSGHESDREFYEEMITKTFRLGANAKLVNECIPGLISVFDVMLGTSIEKVKLKGNEAVFVSRKLNGVRCSFVGDKLMSRQGKEFKGLEHIISDLKRLVPDGTFVDGELLYKNKEGLSDSASFQKGTGIAMSKDIDKTCLKYVIFDMLPLAEFWRGRSNSRYSIRKKSLIELGKKIEEDGTDNLEIVPFLYEGTDHSKIWECLDYAEEHDWEGVVVNLDTPYECKRTKNLIKVKEFFTADILCTGIEEGSGRNKGTLGAIICDYKGNALNVGSGFSDKQRKYYWQHPEEVVGKIVTVKYKEETKNKDGGISIQFPTFETVRQDKTEPNYDI